MNDKGIIGMRIKKAREKARYTQTDAAKKLGIHNSTLGKYELGEREPDIETIKKIASLYEVSPVWILFGDDLTTNGGREKDAQGYIELLEQEAKQMGLTPDNPIFKKMLSDAFDLLRLARGKDTE